jgi:hypothetical protein
MYFDTVVLKIDLSLVINDTPHNVRRFLTGLSPETREIVHVIKGETLKMFTVEEYLNIPEE